MCFKSTLITKPMRAKMTIIIVEGDNFFMFYSACRLPFKTKDIAGKACCLLFACILA